MLLRAFFSVFRYPARAVTPFLLLTGANILFGLLVAAPFRKFLADFAEYRLEGGSLADEIDIDFLLEFLTADSTPLNAMTAIVVVALPVYLIFTLFVSAGFFAVVTPRRGQEQREFWSGAAGLLGSYVKSLAFLLPLVMVAGSLVALADFLKDALLGEDPLESTALWASIPVVFLAAALLFVIILTFDYARAHLAAEPAMTSRSAVWRGLRFVLQRPARTAGFGLLCLLAGGLLLLAWHFLSPAIPSPSPTGIVLMAVLQQTLMASRQGLRLIRYAGTVEILSAELPSRKPASFAWTSPPVAPPRQPDRTDADDSPDLLVQIESSETSPADSDPVAAEAMVQDPGDNHETRKQS